MANVYSVLLELMRCISPIRLRTGVFVPCGRCNFCLDMRRKDWSFRLSRELRFADSGKFLTLTYDDGSLPLNEESGLPEVSVRHIQLFMKKFRNYEKSIRDVSREQGKRSAMVTLGWSVLWTGWLPLRYYCTAEYGTKGYRPHYHLIVFNQSRESLDQVQSIWGHGHVDIGTITPASVAYVCKYHVNVFEELPGRSSPFVVMSRKPGIGSGYLKNWAWHSARQLRNYRSVSPGIVARLPRFYRDRIFAPHELRYLELMRNDSQYVDEYWKEVKRISESHPDPENYYVDRVRHQHDSLKNKANATNKF